MSEHINGVVKATLYHDGEVHGEPHVGPVPVVQGFLSEYMGFHPLHVLKEMVRTRSRDWEGEIDYSEPVVWVDPVTFAIYGDEATEHEQCVVELATREDVEVFITKSLEEAQSAPPHIRGQMEAALKRFADAVGVQVAKRDAIDVELERLLVIAEGKRPPSPYI